MRKRALALALACFAASAITAGVAQGAPTERVTLCHYTGDSKTPYNVIETSPSGAYNAHYSHHDDIIQPFQFKGVTYSRNWDAEGRAIWNNGCVPLEPGQGGGQGGPGSPPPATTPSPVVGQPSFTG